MKQAFLQSQKMPQLDVYTTLELWEVQVLHKDSKKKIILNSLIDIKQECIKESMDIWQIVKSKANNKKYTNSTAANPTRTYWW